MPLARPRPWAASTRTWIRDHEYRHQRGLYPDDGGWRHLLRGRFPRVYFAAYAPYASGANASTLPGTDGKITVNTSNQPTTTEQEKVDYIHATGAKADKDSPTVAFTDNTAAGGSDCSFKHKMARLILKVQVSNTDGFDDTAVLEFADYKIWAAWFTRNVRCEDRYRRDRGQRCERLDVTPVHRCPEDGHGQVRGNL